MPRGGYQQPTRPAPASGPGPLSRRTDGGPGQPKRQLANAEYGEQAQFQQIQGGASMSGVSGPEAAMAARPEPPPLVGLGDPTQRPEEPTTFGSPSGPGAGPAAIGLGQTNKEQNELDARQIAAYLPSLERSANQPGVPTSFVRFVKYLREFQA